MRGQEMTRYTTTARRAASAAALLAAAGLALAGCKSSSAASGGASSPSTGNSTATAGSGGSGGTSSGSGGSGSGSGSGGTPYFPAAVGDTWVYETSLASGTHGTITNRMTRVVPVAGGQRVTMETINHAIGTGSQGKFTYIFHSDGSVTVPFTQFGSESVKVTSGSIMWPSESDLASGQTRHSTLVFAVTTAGHVIHVRAHVTVKGGGTQSVTVPAGNYQAQVVDETIREKFDGVSIGITVETWLATGVGPVKSQLLSKGPGSVPGTVEELKSFTKG
jgi:hypothetical protein